MADFEGALPVKTVRDNEFRGKIVDGQSGEVATKVLTVAQEGDAYSAGTNDFGIPLLGKDASGNAIILPIPLPITDNGGTITVDGTVTIQDGGNSITVDASDLDIRDLTHVSDSIKVGDGTEFLLINADGSINVVCSATDFDIRDITHISDSIKVGDGTDFLAVNADGSINSVVTATDLDIRDISHLSDSIKIGDGTDFAAISGTGELSTEITNAQAAIGAAAPAEAVQIGGVDSSGNMKSFSVNADGSLNVVVAEGGSEICEYKTSAAVASDGVVTHDYTITSAKIFDNCRVLVGARGATKIRVGLWNGTTFTVKAVYFQAIQMNHVMDFTSFRATGTGTLSIRIEITNLDKQSSDLFSCLQGVEK